MRTYIDEVNAGAGNGKKHGDSEFDTTSVDLAVEYTKAKSNLCPSIDKSATQVHKDPKTSEELYKALTDKNRAIEILKRRLTNQQIQLGYYLHKNLATEAVLEFSTKCFPHLAEDSTQLSLAMYKFIRDTGGKTRLAQLREKLTDYNNRVHKALLRQEQLVRQGFGFDAAEDIRRNDEVISEGDRQQGDDFRYARKYYKSAKLEMCNQLMGITMQVRKELEMFRACAENVVKLEEERNALVDRVFSMPVEERYGNLHVSMVDHTRKHDGSSTSLRSTVSTSTNTTTAVEGHGTVSLGGALQDMESEAIQLLLLSEKQKNEFVIALEEARVENQQLKERLRDLEEAASDERVILLQEKCNTIEREVEAMQKDLEAEQNEKEMIIKRMAAEIDERDLNDKNMRLEIKKLKATVDLLRSERDSLQGKLNTASAASQFIDQINQVTSTDDMIANQSEPVSQQDVNDLTDLVVLQEEQIKDLLSIMSDLNVNEDVSVTTVTTTEGKTSSVVKRTKGNSKKSAEDSGISPESKPADEKPSPTLETEEQEYHIFYDSTSDYSNQETSEDGRIVAGNASKACESKASDPKKSTISDGPSKLNRPRSRSADPRRSFIPRLSQIDRDMHRPGLATTSLRVQSFDKDGRSESMQAVLECSSPVDGLLEMNNSSKLHLRLQCTSPQRIEDYVVESNSRDDTSCPFCPEKHVSGDHIHPVLVDSNNEICHLSREAKAYLSKQLNKIKSRLQTSKSSVTARKEIVENLNEIYSQLFGNNNEVITETTESREMI